MKSKRFIIFFSLFGLIYYCGALNYAFADDELPPPQDTVGGAAPNPTNPPPQEIPTTDEDSLPELGGQEDLPAPSLGDGKDDPANQVNNYQDEDNIFLPTPSAQDDANFSAPMDPAYTNYNNSGRTYDYNDWRSGMNNRPAFNLYVGFARRSFVSGNIGDDSSRTGPAFGASYRIFDLGQTVFLHAYIDYMNFKVGDIITSGGYSAISGVNVQTIQYGGLLEIGVGRRVSLFGSLLRKNDLLTADPIDEGAAKPPRSFYDNVAEPAEWRLGVGLLYDFYVVPHGSLGIRGHVEQDLFTITLSLSMEPIPRAKLQL